MLQGAVFDLDGTILDSMHMWSRLGSDYLRSIGGDPQPDLDEQLRALSLEEAAALMKQAYDLELPADAIVGEVKARIRRFYEREVMPKPGMEALLIYLHEHGAGMCIATATDRELAEAALKRCGLRAYFTCILTCSEVGVGKNQPDIYRSALARLGSAKAQTAVFEDAAHALATAKADGFFTVAVHDDSEPDQDAVRKAADLCLPDDVSAADWKLLLEMKGMNDACADV